MKDVIIFGYDEYAKEIAESFKKTELNIKIYLLDEASYKQAIEDGYKSELVELDDDWLEIQNSFDISTLICFCSLLDDSKNMFLTISLRAQYSQLHIVSLATSSSNAKKLRLAGANNTIAKLETTAHVIVQSLERPCATKVLNDIIYQKDGVCILEVSVLKDSTFYLKDIEHLVNMSRDLDIMILSISSKGQKIQFSFNLKQEDKIIQENDTIVFLVKDNGLEEFEKKVKGII